MKIDGGLKRFSYTPLKTFYGTALKPAFFLIFFILLAAGGIGAEPVKPYFTDTGQFSFARFLEREGELKAAAREYGRLIEKFPSSALIADAQFRQATAYLNAGLFHEAERSYRLFIENFKFSPFRGMAEKAMAEAHKRYIEKKLPVVVLDRQGPALKKKGIGIRAVQVALFDGASPADIGVELRALKEAGVDTVIVRVFQNPGDRFYRSAEGRKASGVYFRTREAPVIKDLLQGFVRLAHDNGLKIFAWMTTRYADYGIDDESDLACKGYDLRSGKNFLCKGLDLFNERAIERLEALFSDLADYDIDGILLQDDLILKHNEGFGPYASALFKKDTGHDIDPTRFYTQSERGAAVDYTPLFWQWASWKNKRLLKVAGGLKKIVREKNPDVRFAINLMYESVTNPPAALAWLSQSLAASVKTGFDYYSIMAYHRQMERELNKPPGYVMSMIEKMVGDAVSTVGEPEKVLVKFQTVDWRTGRPLADDEMAGLLKGVALPDGVSVALVPYRANLPVKIFSGKKGRLAAVEFKENRPAQGY